MSGGRPRQVAFTWRAVLNEGERYSQRVSGAGAEGKPRYTRELAAASVVAWTVALALAILAETAFAGTIDLGTVGGVNYSGNSSSAPIVPNGVEIGPDAECASGTRLVGGGVEIGGDFAESQFTRSAPGDESLASGQSWVTVWANLAGSGKTASVTAACMDREVRRVRETKTVEAGGAAAVKVSCPAGTQVSGGGGFIEADEFQSYLNSSYPIDGGDRGSRPDDGWKVRVRNSPAGSGKATVEARCVQFDPSYLVGGQFLIPPV